MKPAFLLLLLAAFSPVLADPALTPGPVIGIGTELKTANHHPVVGNVMPNSPADKEGIRTGDRFLCIDGASVEGMTLVQVADHLRGSIGSPIRVTVLRHGSERTFDMRRQIILMPGSQLPGQ